MDSGIVNHLRLSRGIEMEHFFFLSEFSFTTIHKSPNSNREPLVSKCKSLTTKLRPLKCISYHQTHVNLHNHHQKRSYFYLHYLHTY